MDICAQTLVIFRGGREKQLEKESIETNIVGILTLIVTCDSSDHDNPILKPCSHLHLFIYDV